MAFTPLVWVALFFASIVAAFMSNPVYAALGYLLEYYQRPALHWWGRSLPDLRWNLTISLVLAAAFLLRRTSLPSIRSFKNPAIIFLVLQGLNTIFVSMAFAIRPNLSWTWAWQFWKLLIFYGLLLGVVRTPAQFDMVVGAHIAGSANWGYDALDKQRVQSRLEDIGSGDTKQANTLAAHLLTVVPLIAIWLATEKDNKKRLLALVALPLVLNMFVLCNSRGATLGFMAGGLATVVLVGGFKQRVKVLGGALACGLALFMLADPEFIERQGTTTNATDSSAQSRFTLWRGGIEMVKDHPLGVGGRGYQALSPFYAGEVATAESERSPHNTYIEAATDWGVQGFLLFIGFIFSTLRMLHRVRKLHADSKWVFYRSLAIEVGLISTLVAGFFSVRFYGESIYWMSALSVVLNRLETVPRDSEAAAEAKQAVLRPHQPRPAPAFVGR